MTPPHEKPHFDYDTDEGMGRLAKKSRDSPLVVAGLASFFVIAGLGIYKFRDRKKLSASNYLMQLRVTAQGAVIGFLTLGIVKSLYDRYKRSSKT